MAPDFRTIKLKVTVSDLRNCRSDESLSTEPWWFFSSFIIFAFLFILPETMCETQALGGKNNWFTEYTYASIL